MAHLFRVCLGGRTLFLHALGEVVDGGELDERGEDEDEAEQQKDVERRRVGDRGDALATRDGDRARRQQSRDACSQIMNARYKKLSDHRKFNVMLP